MGDKGLHLMMGNNGVGMGWGTKSPRWGPMMGNEGLHPTMWNDNEGMGW
eukprot:CAMPEP_0171327054 /NCGR_PEP_ID=MMETSP0816-20121228/117839_1 /TAXON_ID=420281 /ORGANISM="Proboscia inermis, Strain CCAP1064/1" /LENGTH=48 /DNA_ID= /DNA_START= /DNA_END= /DNA_ORIENTATION=